MSIVQLKKITLYGCLEEKQQILDALQQLGCIHLNSLSVSDNLLDRREANSFLHTREALKHLTDSPKKLKQNHPSTFDPASLEEKILHNKQQIEALQNEKELIQQNIKELTPWGNFNLPPAKELANLQLWFYIVSNLEMKKIDLDRSCAKIINNDQRFSYIVVVSESEPEFMPGTRVTLPQKSLQSLQSRLDQIEFSLEDLQLERIQLTRWLDLFEKNLFQLEDATALENASHHTYDHHSIFAVQGWIPLSEVRKVKDYAQRTQLAIQIEDPIDNEQPPTLLNNKEAVKGGEDLLSFYMTPSYSLWDPSTTVFFSFAIFFAMIFSDAGYAIILGSILACFWKRLGKTESGKRFRNVLLALTVFSFIWGILVGSYFGMAPSSESKFRYLKIIDMSNYAAMMMLAILVGVIHIVFANLAQAWAKRNSSIAIANIGWAIALIGGTVTFLSSKHPIGKTIGFSLIAVGLIAVVLFTSIEKPFYKRLMKGFISLTRVSGMFGDVLSYLRLFALGLASASLAAVFNDLAKQVYQEMSGFKIILAILILVIGHTINFGLSLMSGFIHGLRLNFIEFFNWGLPDEGKPFKAFSKKEMSKWNH